MTTNFASFIEFSVRNSSSLPTGNPTDYRASDVLVFPDHTERKLYCGDQHFLSIVRDNNGAIAIRPRPGTDPNGWGSSVYLEPFLPGATLRNTNIDSISASTNGIHVVFSGIVSRGQSSSYGSWNSTLDFKYKQSAKSIDGSGTYNIRLQGPLNGVGDLNLYKLASNYLLGVPLVSGGTGNTGDTDYYIQYMTVDSGSIPTITSWTITNPPATYPLENLRALQVTAFGNYNEVDTAAQGNCPIKTAYKPSLSLFLFQVGGTNMNFGAQYNQSLSQSYWADNIGVTPWIKDGSTSATNFSFNVSFDSDTWQEDGIGVDITAKAVSNNNPDNAIDVYQADNASGPYKRLAGTLTNSLSNTNIYSGSFSFISSTNRPMTQEFFILKPQCK